MADINQSNWSETDSSNNAASPNGWLSGTMLPSQVEPTARAMMGAIKRWHDQISPTLTSGGTGNAQTLTHTVGHTALVAGDLFAFIIGNPNTAATTLNVDGLGAVAIQLNGNALVGGELAAGRIAVVAYDGSVFQLLTTSGMGNFGGYTPVVTASSGTFTTVSATGRYRQLGKLVFVEIVITITTNGTAATQINVTAPVPAAAQYVISGRTNVGSGKMLQGYIAGGVSSFAVLNYDNSYPGADGYTLVLSGMYEAL